MKHGHMVKSKKMLFLSTLLDSCEKKEQLKGKEKNGSEERDNTQEMWKLQSETSETELGHTFTTNTVKILYVRFESSHMSSLL